MVIFIEKTISILNIKPYETENDILETLWTKV